MLLCGNCGARKAKMTGGRGLKCERLTNAEIADEIEGWASGEYGYGGFDVLSATETVGDYWKQIVAALRRTKG